MKEKNDFKAKKGLNELAQPHHCLHCNHEALEEVQLKGTNSRFFIKRLSDTSFLNQFFPRQHPLYGWRCMNCGYVMWFTARYLD